MEELRAIKREDLTLVHVELAAKAWADKAKQHADVAEKYRLEHGAVLANSTAKNAEGRKAEADLATTEMRKFRDRLEIEATALRDVCVWMRGGVEPNR